MNQYLGQSYYPINTFGYASTPQRSYTDSLYSALGQVPLYEHLSGNQAMAQNNYYGSAPNNYAGYGQNSFNKSLLEYFMAMNQYKTEPENSDTRQSTDTINHNDKFYQKHYQKINDLSWNMTSRQKADKENFESHFRDNEDKYQKLAKKTHIPAKWIAALHWRESGGDFNKKLRDGTSLGNQSFEKEAAAVLKEQRGVLDKYGVDENADDLVAFAAFAESWNGLGYANKGKVSPYVYSGTTAYTGGKYVQDGVYDSNVKDKQLGVVALMA